MLWIICFRTRETIGRRLIGTEAANKLANEEAMNYRIKGQSHCRRSAAADKGEAVRAPIRRENGREAGVYRTGDCRWDCLSKGRPGKKIRM